MYCVNLRQRFGTQYRIGRDEAYLAEYGRQACRADPWLDVVLCQRGEIYSHGGTMLAAATRGRGPTAQRLMALPCCQVWQDADDGVTVLFDVADFNQVATLMLPRKKRRWTAEQRAKMMAAGTLFGVLPRYGARSDDQICEVAPQVGI
ncbi:MAG TPA: hypothetical protein VMV69_09245 [Pirellulales bacterium]|nr:hypothetical protein [Pirellulales bacterium]